MKNGTMRSSLLALVGVYMLYLAWELIDGMRNGASSMAPAVSVLFAVLFAAAGIFIFLYTWRVWKEEKRREAEGQPEEKREKEDRLTKD